MKSALIKHITSQSHKNSLSEEQIQQSKTRKIKDNISTSMRQLSYFCLKSNMAFEQFDKLLATVNFCNLELGNINHSSQFIKKFLMLIDTEIILKTAEWFKVQENITITLDIGTMYGMPLLAVLFISDGNCKLADLMPLTSKKGEDVAIACYEACKLHGTLNDHILKNKVVGITGDGAFTKNNAPFKNKIQLLFEKSLVFRWDLLHLINRAHIDAKGSVDCNDDDDN